MKNVSKKVTRQISFMVIILLISGSINAANKAKKVKPKPAVAAKAKSVVPKAVTAKPKAAAIVSAPAVAQPTAAPTASSIVQQLQQIGNVNCASGDFAGSQTCLTGTNLTNFNNLQNALTNYALYFNGYLNTKPNDLTSVISRLNSKTLPASYGIVVNPATKKGTFQAKASGKNVQKLANFFVFKDSKGNPVQPFKNNSFSCLIFDALMNTAQIKNSITNAAQMHQTIYNQVCAADINILANLQQKALGKGTKSLVQYQTDLMNAVNAMNLKQVYTVQTQFPAKPNKVTVPFGPNNNVSISFITNFNLIDIVKLYNYVNCQSNYQSNCK